VQKVLDDLLASFRARGIIIPHAADLDRFAEFATFQVRLISDLYRMSNLLPGIGGRIDCLQFNENGRLRFSQDFR
jgi:hypothetical protein